MQDKRTAARPVHLFALVKTEGEKEERQGGHGRKRRRELREERKERDKRKENRFHGYRYLRAQEQREKKYMKKKRGVKGKHFFLLSLRLSLAEAGIFILPGENANHQSQAACYVSV